VRLSCAEELQRIPSVQKSAEQAWEAVVVVDSNTDMDPGYEEKMHLCSCWVSEPPSVSEQRTRDHGLSLA